MRPFRLWRKPSGSKGLYGVSRRRQEQLRRDAYVLASLCRHERADSPYNLPQYIKWRGNTRLSSNEYACFAGTFYTVVDAYWAAQDQGLIP